MVHEQGSKTSTSEAIEETDRGRHLFLCTRGIYFSQGERTAKPVHI
jgi:hypothetical protein